MRTRLSTRTLCASALAVGVVAFAWTGEAHAFVVNVGGVNYDVTTFEGSYNADTSRFTTAEMPWFGNGNLASQFALAVGNQFGFPNYSLFSPLYAFVASPGSEIVTAKLVNSNDLTQAQSTGILFGTSLTYAVATVAAPPSGTSVPGPLPLFGAAAAFGWSRRLRSRIALQRTNALR